MRRLLSVSLAASVAANLALLVAWPRPPATSGKPSGEAPPESRGPAQKENPARPTVSGSPAFTAEPPPVACEQALRECRAGTVSSVLLALEPRVASPRTAAAGLPVGEASPEVQQDLLSQIAREHLRREWERAKPAVVESLRRELKDPDKQRRDAERNLEQFGKVLALGDLTALRERYGPIRGARVRAIDEAISREPPDFGAILAELRSLYADEDKLAESLAGRDAAARFRLSQLEERSVILGIAATYAQAPWDRAIWWE